MKIIKRYNELYSTRRKVALYITVLAIVFGITAIVVIINI